MNATSEPVVTIIRPQLTQEELAKRVGVSQPAIAQYERGTATPRLFVTIRLATALSVSIEDLIGKDV